jgi:hypothetical protein
LIFDNSSVISFPVLLGDDPNLVDI